MSIPDIRKADKAEINREFVCEMEAVTRSFWSKDTERFCMILIYAIVVAKHDTNLNKKQIIDLVEKFW